MEFIEQHNISINFEMDEMDKMEHTFHDQTYQNGSVWMSMAQRFPDTFIFFMLHTENRYKITNI